jgi:hypothetical protein
VAVLGAPAWGFTVTRRRLFVGEARSLSAERLPGYAPDLNPIEQMWGNVESHELANLCAHTIGHVSEAAKTDCTASAVTRHSASHSSATPACVATMILQSRLLHGSSLISEMTASR